MQVHKSSLFKLENNSSTSNKANYLSILKKLAVDLTKFWPIKFRVILPIIALESVKAHNAIQ